jgi:cytidine deaminase
MKESIKKLYQTALKVRENAHCPISNFKVGCAVEMTDGNIYLGCNVESVTFNNSTHAEMNAIDTAIANGSKEIKRILIVIDTPKPMFPCALCRQKIVEFGINAEVISANIQGDIDTENIVTLYPKPFVLY